LIILPLLILPSLTLASGSLYSPPILLYLPSVGNRACFFNASDITASARFAPALRLCS
jgi:hypothetical protein